MEESGFLSGTVVVLSISFLFIFMGAGALQQFLIPQFSIMLGRSTLACSWILASLYLSFLFWRVICSYTLKWLGEYWSMVLGSLTYTIFPLSALLSRNYYFLLVMAIVWGWGAASIWIGGSARILDTTSSRRYGISSGTFYTAAQAGQALGVFLLGWVLAGNGIDHMLLWAFLITLAGNIIMLALPQIKIARESPKISKVFGVLKTGRNRAIAFMQFSSSFGFGVIMSTFADMVKSLYSIELLGFAAFWFYLVRLCSSYFCGWLSDRWGREVLLLFGFLFSALGFLFSIFNPALPVLYLAAGLLGFQFGTVPVVVMAILGDETKPEERHLVLSGLYLWRDLGVAVAILSGMYINAYAHNFTLSLAIFSILFFICTFFSLQMYLTKLTQKRRV